MVLAKEKDRLKTTYRPGTKLEVFYTGGPTSAGPDGRLVCACDSAVKVRGLRDWLWRVAAQLTNLGS